MPMNNPEFLAGAELIRMKQIRCGLFPRSCTRSFGVYNLSPKVKVTK